MELSHNKVEALKQFADHLVRAPSCNLCGGMERSVWAVSDPITAYECTACGLVYHDPQLTDKGRELFYASGYFEMQNDPADSALRDVMYGVEIAFLEKHRASGVLLDVGCGGGFLLNAFSNSWEKHGIEFDARAVEHAREVLNLDVAQGEVTSVSFPEGTFDVIVLRGVIEHMATPREMIEHLLPWLKKGGLLYITSTPNTESLCAELYREKWNLFTADHQIHFSKSNLVSFFKGIGMSLADAGYLYLETPYANEVADYRKIVTDAKLIGSGNGSEVISSPAFYGNMLSLIFLKD
ncbi:MAG: class I SAM-dependent methyltransferase [Patescibacteria group bacterium]